jgi:hypothetical protein
MTREARRRERGGRDERPAAKSAKPVGVRGRAGREHVEEEVQRIQERQNSPLMPFRYRAGWKKGDDFNPIIFLDNSLEDAMYLHIHEVQDQQGNFGRKFEICVKEMDNCPLCSAADGGNKTIGRSTYVMCLSVLDLRPYTNKNGEKVEYSRKLFMVKGLQMPDWIKTLEKAEKRFGTLRGVYMEVGRSSDKDAGTGKPLPLEKDWYGDDADDRPYALIDEADLLDEYGHDAVMGQNNKIIKQADEDTQAYNYDELFKYPDVAALARQYGMKSRNAGSQADLEEDDWEAESEKPSRRGRADRSRRGVEEDEAPQRSSRRNRRDRDAEPDEDEDDLPTAKDDEEDDTPPPPARTKQREAKEEKPSRRTRRSEPEDDEVVEPKQTRRRAPAPVEDDEDEATPPRRRSTKEADAPKEKAKVKTKAEPEEDADEDEDEVKSSRTRARQSARTKAASKPSRRAPVQDEDDEDAF